METDQAQCLLLQAGEQILCPACETPLAFAERDVYAPAAASDFTLLAGFLAGAPTVYAKRLAGCGDRQLFCPCGQGARSAPGLRLLVRSGSWIGWRELGGE